MTKIENAAGEVLSAEEIVLLNKIEKAVFDNIVMRHGDYEAAHKATLDRDDAEQGLRKLAMEATRRGDIEHFKLLLNETTARMERAEKIAIEVEVAAGEYIRGEKEYQPFGSGSLVAENNKAEEVKDVASDVEQTDDVEEMIEEEMKTELDDELFAQSDFINKDAKNIVECAAAVEGGDICIEGKIVNIPDKKGKARYYIYSWDSCGANQYDTELGLLNEKTARAIAAKWHLAFSPMSFEEYMKASNAEYRKIRTLYLEKGGGIARDYDAELFREVQATRAQIDCLDDYVVTLDYDEMAEIEELNAHEAAEKEPTLIDKLRAKVKEQHERRKSGIDWEATFADVRFEELKRLQSEMRRCLRIGETELAASIFNSAKRFFKAA